MKNDNGQPRVNLRAMEPEDLDLLYRIENDAEMWSIGCSSVPYSRYALHEYMAAVTGDIYADKQVRLVIENAQQEPVGLVDLVNFDPKHLRAEIGLVIEQPWRRRGYGVAALSRLMDYARDVLHLHQVFAVVSVDNVPSIQLFEQLHFSASARLSDWLFDGSGYHDALLMQKVL